MKDKDDRRLRSGLEKGPLRERPSMPGDVFEIRNVPLPLDGRRREGWRLAVLSLSLNRCRGKSATREQLGLLMWAVLDEANAKEFQDAWQSSNNVPVLLRAWDDSLQRSVKLGIAAGIFQWTPTARIKLSKDGLTFVTQIEANNSIFVEEKKFLDSFGSFSTTGMWSRLGSVTASRISRLKDQS